MEQLVIDLGLEDNVIFTGYRQDVYALMGMMDVIVHASIRPEPFGMVIIEAMAMEKPVVATRGGGPLDIVLDGKTGLLVEIKNIDELSRAILNLLTMPDFGKHMGLEGRLRVENYFCSNRYAKEMEEVFKRFAK
jgi:glycosyltransferase involved in cell wall biosynthesis